MSCCNFDWNSMEMTHVIFHSWHCVEYKVQCAYVRESHSHHLLQIIEEQIIYLYVGTRHKFEIHPMGFGLTCKYDKRFIAL